MENVSGWMNLYKEIEEAKDNAKTMVYRGMDNSTEWFDFDEDEDAKDILELSSIITKLGLIALENWEAVSDMCPKELVDEVEEYVGRQQLKAFSEE